AWFEPLVRDGREYRLTDYYGTATLTRKDMEGLLDDYYDERGYDKRNGLPTLAKLKELGLEKIAVGLGLPE
ncbi:MAG TPA: aldehyde ferredoxin oxidoreductase C-terminal domain-containing protein, partial [Dehalococcoidales bacterium]